MPNEYTSSWWSIELLSGWNAEEEKSYVSFSAEHGVGALQISAYRHDGETVTDEDLNDFAEDELVYGVIPEDVSCGDFGSVLSWIRCESEEGSGWKFKKCVTELTRQRP